MYSCVVVGKKLGFTEVGLVVGAVEVGCNEGFFVGTFVGRTLGRRVEG